MKTTRRKILSFLLCLTMLLGLLPAGIQPAQAEEGAEDNDTTTVSEWNGSADISWYTENQGVDSYTISTAAQLAGLAKLVNGTASGIEGAINFSGKTITLETDIDLNPGHTYDLKEDQWTDKNTGEEATKDALYQWTPIGTSSTQFTGTFNGKDHTISGLYINASTASNQGFFGYVGSGGTVENLTVSGEVTAQDYVGGVVGYNRGTVTNCTNNCAVTCTGGSNPQRVGGVVGGNISSGTVTNCTNTGTVTATGTYSSYAGGVVGYNSGGTVTNGTNSGDITVTGASASYAGVCRWCSGAQC